MLIVDKCLTSTVFSLLGDNTVITNRMILLTIVLVLAHYRYTRKFRPTVIELGL